MFCELLLLLATIFTTSPSLNTRSVLSPHQIHNITIWGNTAKNATSNGTLQYYLCGNGSHTLSSYTTLSLSSSAVHTITPAAGSFCLLQHLMNIVITSDDTSNPAHIICDNITQPATGFGFLNTTGLTLRNLHIEHCGGILTPTAVSSINQSRVYFPMGQTAVLLFAVSSRLTLNNISITGMYYGYGIIIGNCYDKVTLNCITISSDSKSIKHYCSTNEHSWECAGSGLLLFYGKPSHSIIDVYNVHITDNSNHYPLEDSPLGILLSSKTRKVPLFGAGGITNIVLCDNVQIVYENCTIEHNGGNRGGGMLVIYTPVPTNMDLFMKFNVVSLIGNELTEKGNGAGLAMYVLLNDQKSAYSKIPTDNILHSHSCFICMYNSSFSSHYQSKAVFGGGMYIGLKIMDHYFPSILLDTVIFLLNEANSGGSALYVEEMLQSSLLKALYMNVTMINTFVSNNGRKINDYFFNLHFTDFAVMEFVRINTVHIEGDESSFVYNFGSPIKLSSTNIYLNGSVQFHSNKASRGGAIFLQSRSFLIISEIASVLFHHCRAFTYGGAIYITKDSSDDGLCPFQFQRNDTFKAKQLTFIDNQARNHGSAIYSSLLSNCPKLNARLNFSNSKMFDEYFQLSSPPVKICFCKSNSSYINKCSDHYSTKVIYPGTRITIGVSALDYINQSVYTPIEAVIMNSNYFDSISDSKLGSNEEIQNAFENQCTLLKYTILINISEHSKPRLYLYILGESDNTIYIPFDVSTCPIGFQYCNRSSSCECHPFLNEKKISSDCSITTTSVTIPLNTWLGKVVVDKNTSTLLPFAPNINGTFGFAPVCPTGYCKPGITEANMTEQDSLCQHHRTGVLCGGCEDGYSLVLGPDECQICNSNLWLLMIPVFAIVGIVLVIVLFCLRMTISNQLLGGIIFYVNMTEVSLRTVVLHQHTYGFILNIIFSLLNLELGFSVCLYNGLNALIKTALQFIFPVYLWLIVLMLVIISKRSGYIANLTIHSSIQVMATLFFLSFAKLLHNVIDIFIPLHVQTPHGEFTVWYVDGNISYWRNSGHVALFITAIITSIFYLLPFLLWTTCGSLLARRLRWIKKRRNLIDAYQGQYRDGWGWWFGARLWLLVCSNITYTVFRGNNPSLLLLLHFVFLAPFTFIQVYYKPYRGKWVNIFDCVILIDLLLLEFITLYGQLKGDASITEPYISVLMLLVLLILISLMGWHCMRCMTRYKAVKKIRDSLKKKHVKILAKFQTEDKRDRDLFDRSTLLHDD